MKINILEWDENNIHHISRHGVHPEEVEEACYNAPLILKGREERHLIYGQTVAGRYLFIVGWYRGKGVMRIITVRDMTDSEQKLVRKRR